MVERSTQALIGHIYADSVTRMSPSEPMNVTKHPIENGSIVAEHIAETEMSLTMDCVFTDDVRSVFGGSALTVFTDTTADDKRKAVYKLMRDRKIINIETIKDHYESMVLVDIQEDITPQNASSFVAITSEPPAGRNFSPPMGCMLQNSFLASPETVDPHTRQS